MDRTYFERLHVEEARCAEWRALDLALATRPTQRTSWRRLRVALGHGVIALGQRISGPEQAAPNRC